MEACNLQHNRLFLIPGNHDLSRETVTEMLPAELQKPFVSDETVQKWLLDEKRLKRALEPFENFRAFATKYTGQTSPDFASIARYEVHGTNVALLG